jgi:hypothetical protein
VGQKAIALGPVFGVTKSTPGSISAQPPGDASAGGRLPHADWHHSLRTEGDSDMADYLINVFLDDAKLKKIEAAGLADKVVTLSGKKAVQVEMSAKEHKKLVKGFPDLSFDASNACALPPEAEDKLFNIVTDMKTLDVMKFAIMKLYNPLAGKAPRSAQR